MAFDGTVWNENSPTNADLANEIDDNMRDMKIGVRSRMAIEHKWSSSQTATGSDGYHTIVSLSTQTSQPGLVYGTATQAAALYAITSGTGVAALIRNSAGYTAMLMHSSYQGAGVIPKGGIIMWSGTIATIPAGWALCDGNNGTPNLVDKFIVAAKQDDAGVAKTNISGSLLQTGGAITVDISHTHTVSRSGWGDSGPSVAPGVITTKSDGGGGSLYHAANDQTTSSSGSSTTSILNPFYALALIMKL